MTQDIHLTQSPTLRVTAWLLIALVFSIVVGSWIGKTEIVAQGQGRVIPSERTKVIQSHFSGKISKIPVWNGDKVQDGAVVFALDATEVASEVERLSAELDRQSRELVVSLAILQPLLEYDPASEDFRNALEVSGPGVSTTIHDIEEIEALVYSALSTIRLRVLELDAEIEQVSAMQDTQRSRVNRAEKDFEIVKRRNASTEMLRDNGTISNATFLDRLREFRSIEAELLIAKKQADEFSTKKKLIRQKRHRILSELELQYREAIAESRNKIDGIKASLEAAQNRMKNTSITTPVAGYVENLKFHTIGGHVLAGEEIMSVVPLDSELEVEVFFNNQEAGFIKAGQKAHIKLDAFPAERFGVVTGTVQQVSKDTRKVEQISGWVYTARISIDQPLISHAGTTFPISSGMTGKIDIITGERRLISYFFEPITRAIQDGFRER